MNATKYYVSTTRLVLQGDPDSTSTMQDLSRMLPTLRNSLSCTVCESLLVEPYTPEESVCEHHVCKSCKGGTKKLRPTCSWCRDYSKYFENVQLRILIQNYKKLCGLIRLTRLWGRILDQGGAGQQLQDIVSESEGERKGVRQRCEEAASVTVSVKAETQHEEEEMVKLPSCQPAAPPSTIKKEPPDEIETSPVSKLSYYAPSPSDGHSQSTVKVKYELDVSPNSPASQVRPARVPVSGRKIKHETFILDPAKSKSDLPLFRKLETTPKVGQSMEPESSPGKKVRVEEARAVNEDCARGRPPKRKSGAGGCRCGNATLCPGKLTCCGQRCPCYVDSQACVDCKCKGCRNPHRPGGGKVRPALPAIQNMQVNSKILVVCYIQISIIRYSLIQEEKNGKVWKIFYDIINVLIQ